jgi:hydroxymethylpyrimidine/phosphomethylpyrimidine kinase
MSHPPVVLAVGGLDPSGQAGLAADVRAGAALGALVAPVAAALTVQDRTGVRRVQAVDADLLEEQIAAVRRSLPVGAVKIGMLPALAQARAVAAALLDFKGPVVVDPVLAATSGGALADDGLRGSLADLWAGRCALLTPNIPEASKILGKDIGFGTAGMEAAAQGLRALGFRAVLLKGGHLDGPRTPDYLLDDDGGLWIEAAKLDTPNTRGTGCTLATLVAALLARGQPPRLACIGAKNALTILLKNSAASRWPLGAGPIL